MNASCSQAEVMYFKGIYHLLISVSLCSFSTCMCVCVCEQVIVKKDNQIRLYCKGADNIIFERLSASSADLKELTTHHLNVSGLYACGRPLLTCSSGCGAY